MDASLSFATEIAIHAGKQLLSYFKPNGSYTSVKEDYSVVTEADLVADQFIAEAIQKEYPEDALISEELQPTIGEVKSPVWVVDPLDGTTNFSLGMPIWGVSIARVQQGWPVLAVIYFPVFDELFTAQLSSGAYLNGERIHTRPPIPGQPNSFFSCCTRTHQQYEVSIRYKTRIFGSACYTLCAVARGMAVIGFEATPKIWDISAGWLLLKEAEGMLEIVNGAQPFPLQAHKDYRLQSFPILSAANSDLLSIARQQIKPKSISS
jgi:myo-inositol-1(or 4)-monophosphatase